MNDALTVSLRSVAMHERSHKDNPELAGILDCAANEIERLQNEVELWKDRAASERADHERTIRHCDDMLSDAGDNF